MRDGLLYVLGRFKSLLIGSDGEKYSPEGIEEALVEHSSCIDQLILYNNQSPYTTALLVPNKERLRKHLAHQNLDLTSDQGREEAIRTIQRQINRFRKEATCPPYSRIVGCRPPSPSSPSLSPSKTAW